MPKAADHDMRRETVARAVWAVIRRLGVEGTTLREIARDAGCTTGLLVHYFRNKDELVLFAFGQAVDRALVRIRERVRSGSGLTALKAALAEGLPLDEARQVEGWIWLNFLGRAAKSRKLAAEHRRRYAEVRAAVSAAVRAARRAGDIPSSIDPDEAADTLIALVDGVCAQALLDPKRFSPKRQLRLVDAFVSRLARQ